MAKKYYRLTKQFSDLAYMEYYMKIRALPCQKCGSPKDTSCFGTKGATCHIERFLEYVGAHHKRSGVLRLDRTE